MLSPRSGKLTEPASLCGGGGWLAAVVAFLCIWVYGVAFGGGRGGRGGSWGGGWRGWFEGAFLGRVRTLSSKSVAAAVVIAMSMCLLNLTRARALLFSAF